MTRFTRRKFLAASAIATWGAGSVALSTYGSDVAWLQDVQQPPHPLPVESAKLPPLLVSSDDRPITTLEAWEVERKKLRQAWLEFLGPMPSERPPVRVEVLREETLPEGMSPSSLMRAWIE